MVAVEAAATPIVVDVLIIMITTEEVVADIEAEEEAAVAITNPTVSTTIPRDFPWKKS